jgi:antirestriction protein ArdC
MKLEEMRANLAKSVAEGLKTGKVLWHDQNLPSTMPRSLARGQEFGGLNALYLLSKTAEAGYTDSRWLARPGEQKDVEQDKKIFINKGEKGTTLEHWGKPKDSAEKTKVRTIAYFNVQQVQSKSIEQFSLEGTPSKEDKNSPNYEKANAMLKNLGIEIPKESVPGAYHEALLTAVNNIAKDAPELEKDLTDNLKKLRVDLASSFLSLSLGMGVPKLDPSLPISAWATSIGHDPRQLAQAARDASKLMKSALTKGQELLESLSSDMREVKELSMENLKVGEKIVCKKENNSFIGEVKSVENGEVVIASVLKSGDTREYKNLHERGWKYETLPLEQEKASPRKEENSAGDALDVSQYKLGQEMFIVPKVKKDGKDNSGFIGVVSGIDTEHNKVYITSLPGMKYTFASKTLKDNYKIEDVPYEQTLKHALDKAQQLRDEKVFTSNTKTVELSPLENFSNKTVKLVAETVNYAILSIGAEKTTPVVASVLSLGKENMEKLREAKDATVQLEKSNGKITVKTQKEVERERENEKSQAKTQGLER